MFQNSLYNRRPFPKLGFVARGHSLYVGVHEPSGAVKGFVIFHHGYGAHTGLYDHSEALIAQAFGNLPV